MLLKKTLAFEPLSPLTNEPDEWYLVDEAGFLQNKRDSAVFKASLASDPYYLDALVFQSPEKDGGCFTGFTGSAIYVNGDGETIRVRSRAYIKDLSKFADQRFYINVNFNEDLEEYEIIDTDQLEAAEEIYKLVEEKENKL